MGKTVTGCPRCNAEHSFDPKIADHSEATVDLAASGYKHQVVQEIYLHCPTCRWRMHIDWTTEDMEEVKRQVRQWSLRSEAEISRNTVVNRNTGDRLAAASHKLSRMQSDLDSYMSEMGYK